MRKRIVCGHLQEWVFQQSASVIQNKYQLYYSFSVKKIQFSQFFLYMYVSGFM